MGVSEFPLEISQVPFIPFVFFGQPTSVREGAGADFSGGLGFMTALLESKRGRVVGYLVGTPEICGALQS